MSVDPVDGSNGTPGMQPMDQRLPDRSAPRPQAAEASDLDLEQAVADLKAAARDDSAMNELDFRLDRDLGVIIVTVKEAGTQRVLRQIPSDEALRLARLLRSGRQRLMDRLL